MFLQQTPNFLLLQDPLQGMTEKQIEKERINQFLKKHPYISKRNLTLDFIELYENKRKQSTTILIKRRKNQEINTVLNKNTTIQKLESSYDDLLTELETFTYLEKEVIKKLGNIFKFPYNIIQKAMNVIKYNISILKMRKKMQIARQIVQEKKVIPIERALADSTTGNYELFPLVNKEVIKNQKNLGANCIVINYSFNYDPTRVFGSKYSIQDEYVPLYKPEKISDRDFHYVSYHGLHDLNTTCSCSNFQFTNKFFREKFNYTETVVPCEHILAVAIFLNVDLNSQDIDSAYEKIFQIAETINVKMKINENLDQNIQIQPDIIQLDQQLQLEKQQQQQTDEQLDQLQKNNTLYIEDTFYYSRRRDKVLPYIIQQIQSFMLSNQISDREIINNLIKRFDLLKDKANIFLEEPVPFTQTWFMRPSQLQQHKTTYKSKSLIDTQFDIHFIDTINNAIKLLGVVFYINSDHKTLKDLLDLYDKVTSVPKRPRSDDDDNDDQQQIKKRKIQHPDIIQDIIDQIQQLPDEDLDQQNSQDIHEQLYNKYIPIFEQIIGSQPYSFSQEIELRNTLISQEDQNLGKEFNLKRTEWITLAVERYEMEKVLKENNELFNDPITLPLSFPTEMLEKQQLFIELIQRTIDKMKKFDSDFINKMSTLLEK